MEAPFNRLCRTSRYRLLAHNLLPAIVTPSGPAETITPLIDCAAFRAAEAAKPEFLGHRRRIAG